MIKPIFSYNKYIYTYIFKSKYKHRKQDFIYKNGIIYNKHHDRYYRVKKHAEIEFGIGRL